MQKVPRNEIKGALTGLYNTITFHKDSIFTIKYSYYYRPFHADDYALKAIKLLEEAGIKVSTLEMGDHFHAFVGGAKPGSAKDSYLWVKLEIR